MMKHLLAASLLALLLVSTASADQEWTVVETGRAGLYWSFTLRLNPEPVPPGGVIANESRRSEPPLSATTLWYFTGIEGQTAHILLIFQEFNKAAARIVEIERRPILLTLDKDDIAALTLLPLHAKPVVVKLKRNADQSVSVSLQPK
jgi:hypothetical protein